ncbi:MAG: complex I NDUFA9 subunit family protein, partial [Pseudomonadota bacterium]
MAKAGWRVRVAVRRPNEALFVKPYGVVGQVEPVFCNIRDDASVAQAMDGADAVVNCVGILAESGKNTFDALQHEGADRIARQAAQARIERMVHISAIGASTEADSMYAQTKAQGEQAVLRHRPDAVILRPSIVFGPEDEFFNRFAQMARMGPMVPIVGADTKFQPVYVDDVAAAAERALLGNAVPGIYELGGPDVHTFRDLMEQMLQVIQRRRLIVGMPLFVGRLMGFGFDVLNKVTFGMAPAPITGDQVKNLAVDNVATGQHPGLPDLGITPTALQAVLPDYLWRFRPSGQYADIKASA